MQRFNVLDRQQNIHQNYVIEASAGTGKTYSIENIVVRLLIDENHPCTIEDILVVTFTRAATDDLKMRIRNNLSKVLTLCKQISKDSTLPPESLPDYLAAISEAGPTKLKTTQKSLGNALANFQKAQIFTIHSFCNRMLQEYLFEADASLNQPLDEKGLPPAKVYAVIKDFFRTEINESLLSPAQLQKVLSSYQGIEKLEQDLFKIITTGLDFCDLVSFKEQFETFKLKMSVLTQHGQIDPELLFEDFLAQAKAYKSICNAQKQPKPENCETVKRFALLLQRPVLKIEDFDVLVRDGLYLAEKIHSDNRDKRQQPPTIDQLHYPHFIDLLRETFGSFIDEIRNPTLIFATLASRCRKMLQEYLEQEELLNFDGILLKMQKALLRPTFVTKVQSRFKAAIIDEFQDTDPIQWNIFKTLFAEQHFLYLVGDPKQSIYGFRQADIYTYLAARKQLGENSVSSLDVNYRSCSPLIGALNALFNPISLPKLIALPRSNEALPYSPVEYGGITKEMNFDDDKGSVHFFALESSKEDPATKSLPNQEENYFFPFITDEIQRLHSLGSFPYSSFAILVGDRFQAKRIESFLSKYKIPVVAQHSSLLVETLAFPAFRELLTGILYPRDESHLKKALGGPILCWTNLDLYKMDEPSVWESCIAKCMALRRIWNEQGFIHFFHALCQSQWLPTPYTVAEELLRRQDGIDLYNDLKQIAEILAEEEARHQTPPHKLIDYFDLMENLDRSEGKSIKRRGDPDREGVQILTIHSSKGLEFDVVFALGVIKRSQKISGLIPIFQEGSSPKLSAITNLDDEHGLLHAREMDAEKIRQLYVAFTRAKQRLYIPLICGDTPGKCDLGTASPLELYLARIGWEGSNLDDLYQKLPLTQSKVIFDFIRDLSTHNSIGLTLLKESTYNLSSIEKDVSVVLEPPPNPNICGKPEYMHSFSSLGSSNTTQSTLLDPKLAPHDFTHPLPSQHTLPAGKSIGNLLHAILEKVPFDIVKQGKNSIPLLSIINRFTQNTPFKMWNLVISDIIYNSFTASLPFEDHNFSLCDISPQLCYKEHEFIFSATNAKDINKMKGNPFLQDGYVKGIIDLIFQHQGKYFLLDWKSNWLGDSAEAYGHENLNQAMLEHDYFLQADLYKQALQLYLRLCDPRPFDEIFGGTYYLFLRGLESGRDTGIYRVT